METSLICKNGPLVPIPVVSSYVLRCITQITFSAISLQMRTLSSCDKEVFKPHAMFPNFFALGNHICFAHKLWTMCITALLIVLGLLLDMLILVCPLESSYVATLVEHLDCLITKRPNVCKCAYFTYFQRSKMFLNDLNNF